MQSATATLLTDILPSRSQPDEPLRLHLNHGPIDLVIGVWGDKDHQSTAFAAAQSRFATILDELVSELETLRCRYDPAQEFSSPVARRMQAAIAPFGNQHFITPMAAVAGAVADEIMDEMRQAALLSRAFVNNGGDIAVHVEDAKTLTIGLINRPEPEFAAIQGNAHIDAASGIGGIATSGRHGRSFSLGIADSATALAANAASADAAATIIANHVNINSDFISRTPAHQLDPDSDLDDLLVVTNIGDLSSAQISDALDNGAALATNFYQINSIIGAHLKLAEATRTIGNVANYIAFEPFHTGAN